MYKTDKLTFYYY